MQNLKAAPNSSNLRQEKTTFGLITPSYAPDFERCQLLCLTREQCLPSDVKHYIVVDRRDVPLFKQLSNQTTEILVVEDILPWWIKRIPLAKQGWVSLKSLPIRNWILQQVVKLSIAQIVDEDILGFVDSDAAFIRAFDPQDFVREGKVRLYREPASIPDYWQNFQRWYQAGSFLLKAPQVTYPAPNYIGDLITWKRTNVFKLYRYLEETHSRPWIETIIRTPHFSEYILYGMFVEYILKGASEHYYDQTYPGLHYFSEEPLSVDGARSFLSKAEPHHVTAMISAKSGTPIEHYQDLIKNMLVA